LSPKYMLLVMYMEHYKTTNDLHLLATTIFLWTSWHHTYEKMVKFQAYLM
jgi:hypothetical protein